MPLMIIMSVIFIYIRCIYRVIELTEGWRGYLITHEEYIFAMDALMSLLACMIFVIYHPGLIFGKGMTRLISTKSIKQFTTNSQTKIDYFVKHDDDYDNSSFDPKDWDIKTLPPKNTTKDSSDTNITRGVGSNNVTISQKYFNPYLQPTRFNQYNTNNNTTNNSTTINSCNDHRVSNSISTSNTYTNTNNLQSSNSSEFEFT